MRTASVRFPATVSVGTSRMLFTSRMAHAIAPTTTDPHHAVAGTCSACTKAEPAVATNPKKASTMSSPRPEYP